MIQRLIPKFSLFIQIQGQASESASSALRHRVQYRGMSHAITSIARDEGFRALYFGIKPAIFRQATYGTIKFGVYYRLKSLIMGSGRWITKQITWK